VAARGRIGARTSCPMSARNVEESAAKQASRCHFADVPRVLG
jgi:hypothetical protein